MANDIKLADFGAFSVLCIPSSTIDGLPRLVIEVDRAVFGTFEKVARFDTEADALAYAELKSRAAKTENDDRIIGFAVIPWPTACVVTRVRKVTETQTVKPVVKVPEPAPASKPAAKTRAKNAQVA